jgi:hypothetical protein
MGPQEGWLRRRRYRPNAIAAVCAADTPGQLGAGTRKVADVKPMTYSGRRSGQLELSTENG